MTFECETPLDPDLTVDTQDISAEHVAALIIAAVNESPLAEALNLPRKPVL